MKLSYLCMFFVGGAHISLAAPQSNTLTLPMERFVKVRCSTDGSAAFYEWHGSVFSTVPGEPQKLLFSIAGMNAGRCLQQSDGSWRLVSREVQLYLDPASGEPIHRWTNPWTSETVPVVHVANNPVQNPLPGTTYPAFIAAEQAVYSSDFPLSYPNPLAGNPDFADYGNQPLYQAIEMFKYYLPLKDLIADTSNPLFSNVAISWTRTSPWLPWMKMKGTPGSLVFTAWGEKRANFAHISEVLRKEISTRLPLYADAPSCWLQSRNESSWTYFKKFFAEYLAGARFPIESPVQPDICAPQ